MAKVNRQTASVPITAKGYQVMSDEAVGAAAMNGSPNTMFPKIPVPPAEVSVRSAGSSAKTKSWHQKRLQVGMGISALDERSRNQLATSPTAKRV
jgi:hypothetical protein